MDIDTATGSASQEARVLCRNERTTTTNHREGYDMASVTSNGVLLGSNDNFSFFYTASHRRPAHAWLNVSVLTENPDGGLDFTPYFHDHLGEGSGTVVVPPPPMLDAAMPYLLFAVATDRTQSEVPRDLAMYVQWIESEFAPFAMAGRRASGAHIKAATRATTQWLNEYWSMSEDRRRSVPRSALEERLSQLLDSELPSHNLSSPVLKDLVATWLHNELENKKRGLPTDDACRDCIFGLSVMLGVTGLFAAIYVIAELGPTVASNTSVLLSAFQQAFLDFHMYGIHAPSEYGVPLAIADIALRLGTLMATAGAAKQGIEWVMDMSRFLCEKQGACRTP